MKTMRISSLFEDSAAINRKGDSFFIRPQRKNPFSIDKKKRVNILALGDVGGMVLIGLRLLAGEAVSGIGICDLNEKMARRYEMEAGQIEYPVPCGQLPEVKIISSEELFDCDVMIFCASKGVPPVGGDVKDVRMAQLQANAELAASFGAKAAASGFDGLFAVVSDPVDPLCKAVLLSGLRPEQVQGYGLGVMNSRALYFAGKDRRFSSFPQEGRAFGPHGADLVIANSLEHYDDALSRELTQLAIQSNMKTRELGFKPFIAPALSSGAISIVETMTGGWHYSSVYFGRGTKGAFLGVRNRRTPYGIQVEDAPLPEALYLRVKAAYDHLAELM